MAVEQFSNAPQTTITEDLTDVETDVDVASAAGFPAAAQYRILIESELMLVTAGAGTTTWTVTRGAEGTANVAHSSGATVTHVLTAGAIAKIREDWGLFPITPPPVVAGWTWVNQGSATITQSGGNLWMYCPAEGTDHFHLLKRAAPSTPYSVVLCVKMLAMSAQYPQSFYGWRQSSDGKIVGIAQYVDGVGVSLGSTQGDATPKMTGHYVLWAAHALIEWLKFEDNGTNRIVYYGLDGMNWIQLHSVGRTDYLTGDEIFWGLGARNGSYPVGSLLMSWKEA